MSDDITRITDMLEAYLSVAREGLAISRENQRISIINMESNQQMLSLYRKQYEARTTRGEDPDACLFVCRGPGKQTVFASTDSDEKQTWPQDDWTMIERIPLVVAGIGDILLDKREK